MLQQRGLYTITHYQDKLILFHHNRPHIQSTAGDLQHHQRETDPHKKRNDFHRQRIQTKLET